MCDFHMGTRFACISPFLHFGLHFPPQRRSCWFIPHLLCAADTGKQVQGSPFRERHAGKTEQASGGLTQALGEQAAAERREGRSLFHRALGPVHMPGTGSKAGTEDEQKGRALSSPELAHKYAPARRSATWTCWETPSPSQLSASQRVKLCISWQSGRVRPVLKSSPESSESQATSRSRQSGLVCVSASYKNVPSLDARGMGASLKTKPSNAASKKKKAYSRLISNFPLARQTAPRANPCAWGKKHLDLMLTTIPSEDSEERKSGYPVNKNVP